MRLTVRIPEFAGQDAIGQPFTLNGRDVGNVVRHDGAGVVEIAVHDDNAARLFVQTAALGELAGWPSSIGLRLEAIQFDSDEEKERLLTRAREDLTALGVMEGSPRGGVVPDETEDLDSSHGGIEG